MKTKLQVNERLLFFFKCLLFCAILTGILLLLLAFLMYRLRFSEGIVTVCITAIYVITTFFTGKREGSRKFLWGLLAGSIYFILLLILSMIMKSPGDLSTMHTLTVLALCAGGGMLGGMLS